MLINRLSWPTPVWAVAVLLAVGSACASEVSVQISGSNSTQGQIGCALFENSPAFPMDNTRARQIWLPADSAALVCKFANVPPGSYAVAISHDMNSNKKVDTNFLGIPKEGWGVSNNVVPNLRAPRFDEAQFQVKDNGNVELSVKLVY